MSLDLAAWLIAAAVIAAIYWFSRRKRTEGSQASAGVDGRLPDAVAAERIRRQLEEIRAELSRLAVETAGQPDFDRLREKRRKECVDAELDRAPIAAAKSKGLNETVLRALRDAGFKTIGSLDSIRQHYVEGIGPEREDRLFKIYKGWREAAEAHVRTLTDKELDVRTRGGFSNERLVLESTRSELERKRGALEVRRDALLQRASQAGLDVTSVRRPRAPKIADQAPAPLACPRCGGSLLRRRGRHGAFFGCSRYPSCRYTRDAR